MSKKTSFIVTAVLLAAVLFGNEWRSEARFRSAGSTVLAFLDVGQGDATLIRDVEGRTVLIDAGPGERVLEGLNRRLPAWNRDIDLLILTHLDADHITGASALFDSYRIGEIWWNGAMPSTIVGRRILREARARHIPMKVVQSGERFSFSKMSLAVIHPDRDLSGTFPKDRNAGSVSVRLDCGDDSALLAGDAPSDTERDFLDDGDIDDLVLLKASHHGSRHSTSGDFLDAVNPEYAVTSSGKGNRYGHPSARVLIDLRKRGVDILRTDREGDIIFTCDGSRLRRSSS